MARIMVTGGAGFIGSAFVRAALAEGHEVLTFDKLTYAANPATLDELAGEPRHRLVVGDVGDEAAVTQAYRAFQPAAVVHLAAESHVDRSIDAPEVFLRTNVMGTHRLLACGLAYWRGLAPGAQGAFRFIHVSTDEVFGSMAPGESARETSPYAPNSPYAASKAGADHVARAWHKTYGFPISIVHASNNYGPRQFPEKLIPRMILGAWKGLALPIYGDGLQVRDWLHVEDHARALLAVLAKGRPGEAYNVGGGEERTNLDVVGAICDALDEVMPLADGRARRSLITHVEDRPGHDRRYALDTTKIRGELAWRPTEAFATGLRKTVRWYLDHAAWWQGLVDGTPWMARQGLGDTGKGSGA